MKHLVCHLLSNHVSRIRTNSPKVTLFGTHKWFVIMRVIYLINSNETFHSRQDEGVLLKGPLGYC